MQEKCLADMFRVSMDRKTYAPWQVRAPPCHAGPAACTAHSHNMTPSKHVFIKKGASDGLCFPFIKCFSLSSKPAPSSRLLIALRNTIPWALRRRGAMRRARMRRLRRSGSWTRAAGGRAGRGGSRRAAAAAGRRPRQRRVVRRPAGRPGRAPAAAGSIASRRRPSGRGAREGTPRGGPGAAAGGGRGEAAGGDRAGETRGEWHQGRG